MLLMPIVNMTGPMGLYPCTRMPLLVSKECMQCLQFNCLAIYCLVLKLLKPRSIAAKLQIVTGGNLSVSLPGFSALLGCG